MAKPGPRRQYGTEITISVTPINKIRVRAMAKAQRLTLPELFAAMIRLEHAKRLGYVTIVVLDREGLAGIK